MGEMQWGWRGGRGDYWCSKCFTLLIKDRAEENRACLLAASRVYQLIPCCNPQSRLGGGACTFWRKILSLKIGKMNNLPLNIWKKIFCPWKKIWFWLVHISRASNWLKMHFRESWPFWGPWAAPLHPAAKSCMLRSLKNIKLGGKPY